MMMPRRLKYGAQYPEKEVPAELTILYEDDDEGSESTLQMELTGQSLKSSQAEARFIIKRIQELMASGAEVTDAFSDKRTTTRIPRYCHFNAFDDVVGRNC